MSEMLIERSPWLDGVMCVSEPLQSRVRELLRNWDSQRVVLLPYPIEPELEIKPRPPLPGRQLIVGFSGRLQNEQKRVERLPELISQLDTTGTVFRFEVVGEGEERTFLESKFSDDQRVTFHGRLTGPEYWRRLQGWDVIVFTSDYEGLPIALLEALSLGVIPVFPLIGSGGDQYVGHIDPKLLYPAAELAPAAQCIARIASLRQVEIDSLRVRCRAVVQPHLGDGYIRAFGGFVRLLLELPRIASTEFPRRSLLSDACPFFLKGKMCRLRRLLRLQSNTN
jgi:glycosyltransferase involved in cell wall biosynthesis